jgi:hypothetical protein
MKEAADRGGLLCGPPAADHDRFGSFSDFGGRDHDVRFPPLATEQRTLLEVRFVP